MDYYIQFSVYGVRPSWIFLISIYPHRVWLFRPLSLGLKPDRTTKFSKRTKRAEVSQKSGPAVPAFLCVHRALLGSQKSTDDIQTLEPERFHHFHK